MAVAVRGPSKTRQVPLGAPAFFLYVGTRVYTRAESRVPVFDLGFGFY